MSEPYTLPPDGPPIELSLTETELTAQRERITSFISRVIADAGCEGCVIGLSGGVDSTLTAHLATEALGKENVHGLVMPSSVNPDDSMTDAERVGETLDIAYDVIEIDPIVGAVYDAYPAGETDQMAAGNVRVRSRAVIAYFVANTENRIVLGTGNRSEALTGYFTKYGDGAVDCHPIGNLYKRQVRDLARFVGVQDDLVEKAPSAEMWEGQTDEEELGMTYDLLDCVLMLHIDGPLSKHATAATLQVDEAAVERCKELYRQSEHKRRMPQAPEPPDL